MLQHFRADRKLIGLQDVGSTWKQERSSEYNQDSRNDAHSDQSSVVYLTWEATFIINIGEPGTSP
jgi:hypothetical protein